ncbi:MAG: anthranilate synthase component I [Lachnospiraceae bacterium]|nr:anthranilate synthase component I [Lachnospiraceae bacterium]
MKLYPSQDECKKIIAKGKYSIIPVSTEMYADLKTPIEVLKILKNASKHVYLLESAEADKRWGRYSFLGYNPSMEISCRNGKTKVKTNNKEELSGEDVRSIIRRIVDENKSPVVDKLPPFTGGLVGYFSYDYIKYSEPSLKLDAKDEDGFSDANLMLFDKVICFDNYRQKIILIQNIWTDSFEDNYIKAEKELKEMAELIKNGERTEDVPLKLLSGFTPLFNENEYCEMVNKGKHYIKEGDIFQVVLSNRLEAKMEGSLLDAYRVLRTLNPSPYMFYFSGSDGEIAGASPETLVKLEDGVLHTFPLAGTRPRGQNDEEDKKLEEELLSDEKERAEHNMLVDLGRNDIGKISKIGSVEVEKYMSIERYSHVMHIGSTVRGEIREDKDALDAVDAILPAGTLSGAPKLRACEIINELEDNKRGIYGGAIGYISFAGNLDTCIAIRLAFSKNGKVFVRSGAGIVADSVPENEYRECINKAAAVKNAIELATEGIE